MNFETEIARLKDTLVVTAEMQRGQGEMQRMRAEGLVVHDKEMAEIRHTLAHPRRYQNSGGHGSPQKDDYGPSPFHNAVAPNEGNGSCQTSRGSLSTAEVTGDTP